VADVQEEIDDLERKLLFPRGMLAFGSTGVFVGFTDLWIEHAKCQFVLDVVPSLDPERPPQINVLLTGTGDGEGGGTKDGFSVRLLAEGFKLKGDKAPVIPVDLSTMKFTAICQVACGARLNPLTCA
jgi:hypothetical protein